MRRKITVYGLRFSKTTFVDHINTGFLDPAVATVPTACGIETKYINFSLDIIFVATVPTACGIETAYKPATGLDEEEGVATVPTACGIETKESVVS